MNDDDAALANVAHAAEAWLQRLGAESTAVAVITIAPRAAVGIWTHGQANVRQLATIDDPAAELCEAVAPVAQRMLEQLKPSAREAALGSVAAGARMQLLVMPDAGEFVLRLDAGGKAVALVAVMIGALR